MAKANGAWRMKCQSWLSDQSSVLVADASVAINLIATGRAAAIMSALPNRLVVVEQVALELKSGHRTGRNHMDGLQALVSLGHIEVVHLGSTGQEQFGQLVAGDAATTLDDGEAATIAYAVEHRMTALIDERKATRICGERFGFLSFGCTVDLLAHGEVGSALGRADLSEAVFNALYHGRMRVPTCHREWVVALIGTDRARRCSSLPRFVRQD